jgi:hypothetical protein
MNLRPSTYKVCTYLSIALILLTACHKQERIKNEISKIEVATGDCYGPCQLTAVSIDSSLILNYYGGDTPFTEPVSDTVKLRGYFTGKISKAFLDTLNKKLNLIQYQQLDSAYQHSVDDQSLEVIIYYKGKVKHVRAQSASLPEKVRETIYWIANIYKRVKLTPVNDPISFHTTEQNPFKAPIDVKDVKFAPPKLNQ